MKNAVRQLLLSKRVLPPPTVIMTSNTAPAPFIVSASSEYPGYEAWQAYDGSGIDGGGTGIWASNGVSLPVSITIDYGSTYIISKVAITGRSTTNVGQSPNTFDLQSSSDGIAFTTFASYTGQTWTASEMKTFTFLPITARYLRINILAVNGSTFAAITLINWK